MTNLDLSVTQELSEEFCYLIGANTSRVIAKIHG